MYNRRPRDFRMSGKYIALNVGIVVLSVAGLLRDLERESSWGPLIFAVPLFLSLYQLYHSCLRPSVSLSREGIRYAGKFTMKLLRWEDIRATGSMVPAKQMTFQTVEGRTVEVRTGSLSGDDRLELRRIVEEALGPDRVRWNEASRAEDVDTAEPPAKEYGAG